jgi:uncharacterized protein (DUF924 family)
MTDQQSVQDILDFWFGPPGSDIYGESRKEWFVKDDKFDALCRSTLLEHYEKAAKGHYNHWQEDPWSGLALLILLDQVPRNLFRGSSKSFATDAKARGVTRYLVDNNMDQTVLPIMRVFMYLPLEHSEDIIEQNMSVSLFEKLGDEGFLDYAKQHQVIVERFGRFPHRNVVMGRDNTDEEEKFLKQPNSGF